MVDRIHFSLLLILPCQMLASSNFLKKIFVFFTVGNYFKEDTSDKIVAFWKPSSIGHQYNLRHWIKMVPVAFEIAQSTPSGKHHTG